MKSAKRRPAEGAGPAQAIGADRVIPTTSVDISQAVPFGIVANRVVRDVARRCLIQRTPYQVIITDCVFSANTYVSVEPHLPSRPVVEFRTAREALAFADELGRIEGWRVVDRREFSE